MKNNFKRIISGFAALTIAASMSATAAFADDATGSNTGKAASVKASKGTSTIEMERTGHTYTYYQIFTGKWYEDENGKIWLTDASFGKDLDRDGLIAYLKDTYADKINDIYVGRAVRNKIVPEGATIDDVKAAIVAWQGEDGWASSDYNIANFSVENTKTNSTSGNELITEDVLDLFKLIQEENPDRPSDTPHIAGSDYSESENHGLSVTDGNKIVIDILRQFKKGSGKTIPADYNEKKTIAATNGYYLVTEKDEGWDKEGKNAVSGASREAVLMKIVSNQIVITPKLGTPTVEKKIYENVKNVDSVGDSLIGAYKQITKEDFNFKVSQNPDENKWYYNIDREDAAHWNDAADYFIGSDVPFVLFGSLAENIRDYKHYYYKFDDRLAKGFDAPAVSDIKVQIGRTNPVQKPSDGDNAANQREFDGIDVTDKANITITKNDDGSSAIGIEFADILALNEIEGVDIDMDTVVMVSYTAKLNKNAVVGSLGNTNAVYLEYSNDVNYTGEGKPETDRTHDDGVVAFTYQVNVNKVDSKTKQELENAVFTLQAKDGDHAGQYVVVDRNGKVDHWTDEIGDDNYLITDAGGDINVIGLDDGKYEVVEVKAPKGYHTLREPIEITMNASLNKNGTYFYIKDDGRAAFLDLKKGESPAEALASIDKEKGAYMLDIGNNKGITLPETGGAGAIALYSVGGLFTVAGGTYYATRKKKPSKDNNEEQ